MGPMDAERVLGIEPGRAGTALLAFGVIGSVLAAAVAIGLIVLGFVVAGWAPRVETAQASLEMTLSDASFSVGQTALATANLRATVETSQTAIGDAATVLDQAASTVAGLASSIDVTILGQRPFGAAADDLNELSTSLAAFGQSTAAIATDLTSNVDDLEAITANLRDIQADLDAAVERLAAFDDAGRFVTLTGVALVLAGASAAWTAVAAALVAWVGRRLRRTAPRA
jgi:hypothetical protein